MVHKQTITYPSLFILTAINDTQQASASAEVSVTSKVEASLHHSEDSSSPELFIYFDAVDENNVPLEPYQTEVDWKRYAVTPGSPVEIQWALQNEKTVTLSVSPDDGSTPRILSSQPEGYVQVATGSEKIEHYLLEAEDGAGHRLTKQISIQVIRPLICEVSCEQLFLPLLMKR